MLDSKKIAIVHDWLTNMGGAEKNNLEPLLDIFPNATIYTSTLECSSISEKIKKTQIITSFLQKKLNAGK